MIDRTGQRYGKLTVQEFAGMSSSHKTRWLCVCDCGQETIVLGGNLQSGLTKGCGCGRGKNKGNGKGNRNGKARSANPGYRAVHKRLRKDRGLAKSHLCVVCAEPALHWAYDNSPTLLYSAQGSPYSVDQSKYRPLCVVCHQAFDKHEA